MTDFGLFEAAPSAGVKRRVSVDGEADGIQSKRACVDDGTDAHDWGVWPVPENALCWGDTIYGQQMMVDGIPSIHSQENPAIVGPGCLELTPNIMVPDLSMGMDMAMLNPGQITDTTLFLDSLAFNNENYGLDWDASALALWGDQQENLETKLTSVDIPGDAQTPYLGVDYSEQPFPDSLMTPLPSSTTMHLETPSCLSPFTELGYVSNTPTTPSSRRFDAAATGFLDGKSIESEQSRLAKQLGGTGSEILQDEAQIDLDMQAPETIQYDTCFGEIVGSATSSFNGDGDKKWAHVDIEPFGTVLKLSLQDSRKYAGIISMTVLNTLLKQYTIRLAGTLYAKSTSKGTKAQPNNSQNIRIILYGCESEKEAVGSCLSEAGIFLQHPTTSDYDHLMPYINPQYLLRPGSEMPNLEDLVLCEDGEYSSASGLSGEDEKAKIMRIFDSANPVPDTYEARCSPRLASTLKEHQLVALSMMVERESGKLDEAKFPSLWQKINDKRGQRYRHKITGNCESNPGPLRGGILADEMGLGKTLSLLSLVCLSLDRLNEEEAPSSGSRATLIVTSKSTIPEWERQIKRHIHSGQVQHLVYHGLARRQPREVLSQSYDIVITTYETLRLDCQAGSGLYNEVWYRLVLDEAHHIRNRSSKLFKAVASIKAHFRWCLTGTPIQNSLDDYGALLNFLRVPALAEKSAFDYWIATPMKAEHKDGLPKLQYLVAATAFRRTKAMVNTMLELPAKVERIEMVRLSDADRELYDFFKAKASKTAHQLYNSNSAASMRDKPKENTLSLINLLRAICNHGEYLLPESALNAWRTGQKEQRKEDFPYDKETPGSGGGRKINENTNVKGDWNFPDTRDLYNIPLTPSRLPLSPSAKVRTLLENLQKEQRTAGDATVKPTKSIVFSQWTRILDLVAQTLQRSGYTYTRIDGQSSLADRHFAMQRFSEDDTCTIMLASIGSAAEGVDLTAASYVHLLEPHWNPMVEAQAIDRVHRIGQSREVVVTRYLTENSIESYVRWIQEDKLRVISQSLGSASMSQSDLDRRRWKNLQSILGMES